jgi:hypothetical protein
LNNSSSFHKLIMKLQLLDGASTTEPNTGSAETVGELTGENQDFSELECTRTIWPSRMIAHGEQSRLKPIGSTSMRLKSLICESRFDDIDFKLTSINLVKLMIY